MSRCVRRALAAAAGVFAAVIVLGSCSLGFLGDSFTLEGQIYSVDRGDALIAATFSGSIGFVMEGQSDNLNIVAVTNGSFSADIGVPPSPLKWSDMLPPVTPALTVSDASIDGYILNKITATAGMSTYGTVSRSNVDGSVLVWYIYTESEVEISGTGTYDSPFGDSATIVIDAQLKSGWNRMIITRTGSAAPYTDTWTIGKEPDGLYWLGPPG
jgi:hypothetical protein